MDSIRLLANAYDHTTNLRLIHNPILSLTTAIVYDISEPFQSLSLSFPRAYRLPQYSPLLGSQLARRVEFWKSYLDCELLNCDD